MIIKKPPKAKMYGPLQTRPNRSSESSNAGAGGREFFVDNLLVRILLIIVMIRWTGLAPWEFEFFFPGSVTSTFLAGAGGQGRAGAVERGGGLRLWRHWRRGQPRRGIDSSSLLLASLELSDTKVYEP